MATDKIRVAVRVRPFNRRELELGTQCVVEMEGQQTILQCPPSLDKIDRKQPKSFAFDHCFFSLDPELTNYASQRDVFDCLGRDILDNAFQGYNACIFAYGQTGSGKSYTMMGAQDCKGVIPRLCDALFAEIAVRQTPELTYKVEVSYMEIYNEKVHDLLDPRTNKQSLKVREHVVLGPYVDGLSRLAVTSYQDIDTLMAEGNKSRTVAATNMNSESSRSHAVFSVVLTQTLIDLRSGVTGEKVSRMSLVDLAGSERAVKTGAVGDRLKEGSNINKSLTTLGLVISKLADQSSGVAKNKDRFVPYRDSVLTWLLKDNLGGNSKTVMVATISPSADNYEETLSTLRYADRAKRIVNHAVVNEDPNARIIRELRQEVEALKEMLKHATASPIGDGIDKSVDIHEKLAQSENLMKEMSQTWEEKLVKTEKIQSERQQALEKMGISIQASGIKVEKNKYYLVNLNADPSLNELLVYYLKDRTLVGSRNSQADIQLSGLGIQPEHCWVLIVDGGLVIEPLPGARCFVNGSPVAERTPLEHGDRILWGNHHFFRVNCPKPVSATSEPQTPAQQIDYNFARDEIMLNELTNDPIQAAISRLEKQHEEDKQVALEKQRQEYERQFQQLRNILSPSTPYAPYTPYDPLRSYNKMTPCTPTTQMRMEKWAAERDETFKRSLVQLKADILKANSLVQEANVLAEEMSRNTKFSVTLQIPPANLSPNRKRGAFVSEPAILVSRMGHGGQVWSMEKLENKLIDMRDMYEEFRQRDQSPSEIHQETDDLPANKASDPFYESQENHNLIGVANIFLEALFHNVKLDYHTPIISQQGEVAGRLQVELSRVAGSFPVDRISEAASDSSRDSRYEDDPPDPSTQQVICRVSIKQASGLPPSLSHFVFCQYSFWGCPDPIVVPPIVNSEVPAIPISPRHAQHLTFKFEHQKDFTVPMNEEFLEHCIEGALSIEVWGHRSAGFSRSRPGWEVEQRQLAKARSLADRWAELTRKIQVWVEIHELNDQGEYAPVEVKNEVSTGGVYQLRQGQQRRLQVRVRPVHNSGTLPIICQNIYSIEVGSVNVRSRLQKPLDSYQEEDLAVLREKWGEALTRRRQYLDSQIQRIINKTDKTERDIEREQSLVDQWVSLTEERNAVMVPSPGSPIPGAPAAWDPPSGMEQHIPVLFLDLNADDMSTHYIGEDVPVSGLNSILPKELGNRFYELQIMHHYEKDICAIASWDSSIHNSQYLNRTTEANERVYLILKTTVRLSHPAPMDLVLRKRLALNIYKKQSITDRIRKRIVRSDTLTQTGVTYEVVSNIPKASEELEDRESLAQIAASGEETSAADGETYIEKYTRGVSAVESILTLDRLRQSVAVKELQQAQGHTITMRKTASVPNFSQMLGMDSSFESLIGVGRSESVSDLNKELLSTNCRSATLRARHSFGGDSDIGTSKPFGLASPASGKLGMRMTTLHEEPGNISNTNGRRNGRDGDKEDSHSDPENDSVNVQPKVKSRSMPRGSITASRTLDSLHDFVSERGPPKNSPSISSSGYGSQAVSSTNLTNDDSLSIRSMSVDDTPDFDSRFGHNHNNTNDQSFTKLSKHSNIQFKGEITDLKNDINLLKSEILEPKVESNDPFPASVVKTPILTPGSRNRINPFLKEFEDEGLFDNKPYSEQEAKNATISNKIEEHNKDSNGKKSDVWVDPLGCLSVQEQIAHSAEKISNSNKYEITNGQTLMEEDEAIISDQSNSDIVQENRSNEVSSVGSAGDYDSPYDGTSIVRTLLPPGKVVRRRKTSSSSGKCPSANRASFPSARPRTSESKLISKIDQLNINSDDYSSSEKLIDDDSDMTASQNDLSKPEAPLPEWITLGESVHIRLTSSTGVIAYIGPASFALGTWIGVELDTPTGKNDGTVKGEHYFNCKPRHGLFVRPDKLAQDRRGRALRQHRPAEPGMKRATSRGEGLSMLHRSRSRGDSINAMGTRSATKNK